MNTLGIIAEYNPLHNGHIHHIKSSVEKLNPDGVICIMSGNFVQRGAPAIFDKWTRAAHAVKNGVDLAIELPLEFSMASAERFALGGISLLNAVNADFISFGAENSEEEIYNTYSQLKELDRQKLQSTLKSGVNFAVARQSLLKSDVLDKPNNILALEYIKAIEKTNSRITPLFIRRESSKYNSREINENSASAKAIRFALQENRDISGLVPENILNDFISFTEGEKFFSLIKYAIMSKSTTELSEYCEIREGLEHRIKDAVYESETLDILIKNIKSKRYTYSSISRMLFNILLGVKKDNISEKPLYIRVLAANQKGFSILKEIKETSPLPIITKASSAYEFKEIVPQIEKDFLASDIYFSVLGNKKGRVDLTTSPIIL